MKRQPVQCGGGGKGVQKQHEWGKREEEGKGKEIADRKS